MVGFYWVLSSVQEILMKYDVYRYNSQKDNGIRA